MVLKEQNWLTLFPELQELASISGREVMEAMRPVTIRVGTPLFHDGEACENYLLILSGSARVQKLSENGQIITLYHLEGGQTCELTASCLMSGRRYPAEALAETDVRAILLPKIYFQEALNKSPQFRNYVFSEIDKGVQDLVSLVEEVSFGHMDRRLARCLLQAARSHDRIQITHHTLAEELGTAREVVSRILKDFERRGWVRLHRGCIDIADQKSLHDLAEHTIV